MKSSQSLDRKREVCRDSDIGPRRLWSPIPLAHDDTTPNYEENAVRRSKQMCVRASAPCQTVHVILCCNPIDTASIVMGVMTLFPGGRLDGDLLYEDIPKILHKVWLP